MLPPWLAYNFPSKAEPREQADGVAGEIDLVPTPAVHDGGGARVMVVVPAFAERQQTEPPHVAAFVARLVGAATPDVADAVDAPCQMPQAERPQDRAPEHAAPARD